MCIIAYNCLVPFRSPTIVSFSHEKIEMINLQHERKSPWRYELLSQQGRYEPMSNATAGCNHGGVQSWKHERFGKGKFSVVLTLTVLLR